MGEIMQHEETEYKTLYALVAFFKMQKILSGAFVGRIYGEGAFKELVGLCIFALYAVDDSEVIDHGNMIGC